MAGSRVRSPRRIAAAAGVLVLVVGTVAGLFGWETFLGVYAGMFLLLPLAAFTAWGVLKLWETGGRVWSDGPSGREDECADGRADPLEVLRERYAAGELDETELEERVGTLLRTADLDPTGVETWGEPSADSPLEGPLPTGGGAHVGDAGEAESSSGPGRRATDD